MTSTVSVTSRHTVHCANEASWIALESLFRLGAFDQVAGFVPLQVVWVYEQPPSAQQLIPVERLQRAMTLLLDYYPQLTGRIQVDPSSGIREIARLGTGAELLVAQCSERLDASGTSSPESRLLDLPGAGNALLPPFDPTPEGTCRAPIFAIQHTRFACGGVALGVRSHHSVSDADGFFQLVRDLAELYRGVLSSETNDDPTSGVASLAHPPHVRPYMSELVGGNIPPEERQAALDFQPSRLHVAPPASAVVESDAKPVSSPIFSHPVVGRFLRFSSSALAALKVEATEPNGSEWVTTFDALSAHLYQRVHRARLQLLAKDPTFGPLSRTDFLIPVNLRSRLDLPARYFPNTLFTSYTTIPPAVLSGPLWQVAKIVHGLPRTGWLASKDEINSTLKWIVAQPDTRKINEDFQYGNGSFMVSQWNKFDLYTGAVFDVAPALVSPPFTQSSSVDGLVYLLPTEALTKGGDVGAIDVSLALSEPIWAFMDQDDSLV